MLSKFSVRKPYTVLVGVILTLVLGVVSFMNMTVDLLPDINLPYAIVITTYSGANPELVEMVVTEPIEQTMATVSNISNISSTSSESVSMVILEFEQTADMDSATIEMREYLDQLESYWPDEVGSPIIMKLNPDMMPIMVAAVGVSGDDMVAGSEWIESEIISEIESIEGVASVSTTGSVTQTVEVTLNEEKIADINDEIAKALEETFDEAQGELNDAQIELNQAEEEINSGVEELASQTEEIATALLELEAAEEELNETYDATLEAAYTAVEEAIAAQMEAAQVEIQEQLIEELTNVLTSYLYPDISQDDFDMSEVDLSETDISEIILAGTSGALTLDDLTSVDPTDINMELTEEEKAAIEELQAELSAQIIELIDTIEMISTLEEDAKAEAKAAVDEQFDPVFEEIASGKAALQEGSIALDVASITASVELAAAKAGITSAQSALEEGQTELDNAKESAIDAADLTSMLTAEMVDTLIMAQNFSMPAGYVYEDGQSYMIRVGEEYTTLDELENMVLFDLGIDGVDIILLGDVADIEYTTNEDEVYAKINDESALLITVEKQTGYSTGTVSDSVNEKFEELMEQYESEGLTIVNLMDQGVYIELIVDSVLDNMIYGGILAVLILFLFLRSIRPTFIIACSIPISVVAALVLMYFSGITLNIISLGGLALGIGMLVDNSIVVIENIYRMRNEEGADARTAAVEGAKQVAGAIMASTLTTVCVFLPIVFVEGITRQLFVDMGLTIAYSLLASLVIALCFVPMMSAFLLRKEQKSETKIFEKIKEIYGVCLDKALRMKALVLLMSIVLLVASFFLSYSNGLTYIPEMEGTQISITLTTDISFTLEETAAESDKLIEGLLTLDDVEDVGAMVPTSSYTGTSSSTNEVTLYANLTEDRQTSNEELEADIWEIAEDIDGELSISMSLMDLSALGGSGLSIQIKGNNLDTLQEIAADLAAIVESVEGTTNVTDGMEDSDEELRIYVDEEAAAEYNLTVAQVYTEVYAAISGTSSYNSLSTDTGDYGITVIQGSQEDLTREDVMDLVITVTKTDGTIEDVALADIATFEDAEGLQTITRDSQSRTMSVTAEISDDYNVTLVGLEVEDALADYEMPDGYSYEMVGEDETIMEAVVELMKMLGLAILFMYLIMVAQFQSLLSPFIIMFTVPLAFTGGFLGLWISGSEISVIAMVGFVMLAGIIVNNGIVLVDYINQLIESGMDKRDAIITAGKTRLRPIIMTALTTILGLSTMAIGMGMGSEIIQPMALVTIGGLIYGTLLTLFVVPCIYDIFRSNKKGLILNADRFKFDTDKKDEFENLQEEDCD